MYDVIVVGARWAGTSTPALQEERLFAPMRDDPVLAGGFFGAFAGTAAAQDLFASLSRSA